MSDDNGKCFFCGENSYVEIHSDIKRTFYGCETCGYYDIGWYVDSNIDKDIYASFLYYKGNIAFFHSIDKYFFYLGSQEGFVEMQKKYPYALLATNDEVEAWYPKNFSEKIDTILLGLAKLSNYIGNIINLSNGQMKSLFFVKRYLLDKETSLTDHIIQIDTFANYMSEQKFIKKEANKIIILPDGWKRIDELQKNQTDSKQAFVAIEFSENMQKIQEAIEEGIRKARYIPHVMNKSEHNNQIVPEILYQIKQSKFVVAEFSTKNNGAYYEAGYAAGLGKEVIHICKKSNFGKKGHFDIKQKSTILWKTEDEIAELLYKRIEATIGMGK